MGKRAKHANEMRSPIATRVVEPSAARRWSSPSFTSAASLAIVALTIGAHVRNRDYVSEKRIWQDNVEKQPGEPRSRLNLGIFLAREGKLEEAFESASRAIELEPRFQRAYFSRAGIEIQRGNLSEALHDANVGLRIPIEQIRYTPDFGMGYEMRGAVRVDLGEYDQAVADLSKVIQAKPESSTPHYHRGRAYASLGRYGLAVHIQKSRKPPPLRSADKHEKEILREFGSI